MTRPATAAVVGSGVAGLLAAHVLTRAGVRVTLYEADSRLGGHADTHDVETPLGTLGVDTGFIVHNHRTYPHLLRLFDELGVATQESEMSMSVRCEETGLEWAGALVLSGLFPTWRNLARPAYLRMLTEIPRFHRRARLLLERTDGDLSDGETLREFLDAGGYSPTFRTHFMESLVACVWSCDPAVALDYPARYLFAFLRHHGMLGVFGSPTWRTVTGGSREYVDRVAARLAEVRLGTKVTSVAETPTGVEVTDGNGTVTGYEAVVIATHPHQALSVLADPTPLQREVLAAMPYSRNTAQLHTDTSILPRHERARSSWNYLRRDPADQRGEALPVTVSYDMHRLQRLPELPDGTRYVVTLGGEDLVDQERVLATMEYEHPIYTPESVAAQRRLPELDTDRVVLAGAYHGWGFHEDGARSGVAAARRLGVEWPHAGVEELPREPAAYATTIRHTRRRPFRRSFAHRSHTWLVDLDHLPRRRLPLLTGSFEARDHLGDPAATLKDNVEHFLRVQGVDWEGGRIRMAANARAWGWCFNPISVFWCLRPDGSQAAVVVEVHNTYGDRQAYLLHPDEQGRARTEKQMYVSPFHGTDGWYDVAVPMPGDRLHVAVTLHTDDGATFSASLDGERTTTSALRAAPASLRHTLLIHAHGVWLWARRLGVRPRPTHAHQEGVR